MNTTVIAAVLVWFIDGLLIGWLVGQAFPIQSDRIHKLASDIRMRLFTGRSL